MSLIALGATVAGQVIKNKAAKKAEEKAAKKAKKAAKKAKQRDPQVIQPTRAPGTRNVLIALGVSAAYLLTRRDK